MSTYFVQGCPTCGRRLQIRVEHLGRRVVCQHCRAWFVACDPASSRYEPSDDGVMRRVNELLEHAGEVARTRVAHPR
jgi:hypothetical protein